MRLLSLCAGIASNFKVLAPNDVCLRLLTKLGLD